MPPLGPSLMGYGDDLTIFCTPSSANLRPDENREGRQEIGRRGRSRGRGRRREHQPNVWEHGILQRLSKEDNTADRHGILSVRLSLLRKPHRFRVFTQGCLFQENFLKRGRGEGLGACCRFHPAQCQPWGASACHMILPRDLGADQLWPSKPTPQSARVSDHTILATLLAREVRVRRHLGWAPTCGQ